MWFTPEILHALGDLIDKIKELFNSKGLVQSLLVIIVGGVVWQGTVLVTNFVAPIPEKMNQIITSLDKLNICHERMAAKIALEKKN